MCLIYVSCIYFFIYIILWSVVQKMDNVTEGMQSYGGKINAVETDLKKLGKSPFAVYDIKK